MRGRFLPWLWLLASVLAAACALGPNPDIPGIEDSSGDISGDMGSGTGGSSSSGGAPAYLDMGGGGQGGESGTAEAP